ncbi:hypothetical protein [Caulobacter segnis]
MSLAILKTLALAAALATPAPTAADPAACALGARLIAQQTAHGNKVVFDAEDEIPTYPFVDVGTKLPETIRAAVTRQPPRNLFKACPQLADRLPANARFATPEERAEVRGIRSITGAYLTTLSEPLLDRTGRVAVVYLLNRCAGLCANGALSLYHRKGGGWVPGEDLWMMMS